MGTLGKTKRDINLKEVDAWVLKKLRDYATADGRSLSAYLRRLLEQHVTEHEAREKASKTQ